MDIEQQSRQVTDKESQDNRHQDDAQTDLLLFVLPPEPCYGQVYLDIHEGDQGKGEKAEDDQPSPAVVQDVVHRVSPELCGHNPDQVRVLITPDNLNLEELGDIEKDGEDEDGETVLHQSLGVARHVLDHVIVINWLVCCEEPLQRDSTHMNGSAPSR